MTQKCRLVRSPEKKICKPGKLFDENWSSCRLMDGDTLTHRVEYKILFFQITSYHENKYKHMEQNPLYNLYPRI